MSDTNLKNTVQTTSLGAVDGVIHPTSYQIEKLDLYPNGMQLGDPPQLGKPYNLIPQASSIVITEGIFQNSIHVAIGIIDAVGILEALHISGGEKIDIHIIQKNVKQFGQTQDKEIEKEVYISDIKKFTKINVNTQSFVIECVTKPAYVNQVTVLNRSFHDKPGDLVKKIAEGELGIEEKLKASGFGETMKGIYPKLRPFDAINWVLRNADDNGTPVFFFETLRYGFQLKSWEDFLDGLEFINEFYNNYPYPWNYNERGEKVDLNNENYYEIMRKVILEIESFLGFSRYNDARKGAYASNLTTVDISTKFVAEQKFEYEDKMIKLNKFKPFSNKPEFSLGSFDKNKNSRNYFVSNNGAAFDGNPNYHGLQGFSTLQKRESYLHNMDMLTHQLKIPGDPWLSPGDKINLRLWKIQIAETDPEDVLEGDKFMGGKFVIKQITHQFKPEGYTMELTVIKDSSVLDFDSEDPVK